MSFSRSFTFHVSGSVSYPASKSGGSTSYHDSVHVVVNVDTSAFDRSVRSCARQAEALTGAVVSTTRGLVHEKVRAAGRIAKSLVSGFYKYIMYGVREKMMSLGTKIPMLVQALKSLAGHCSATRNQLENDYQQITGRYSNIFNDLKTNLRSALVALDSPVYDLVGKSRDILKCGPLGVLTSQAAISGPEQMAAAGSVEVARIKQEVQKVVGESVRNIRYNIELGSRIDHMLTDSPIRREHHICMPVAKLSCDDIDGQGTKDHYFFSGAFPPSRAGYLVDSLGSGMTGAVYFASYKRDRQAASQVDGFFRKRLSSFASEEPDAVRRDRLTAGIMKMWNANFGG